MYQCIIEGCDDKFVAKGYCNKHYKKHIEAPRSKTRDPKEIKRRVYMGQSKRPEYRNWRKMIERCNDPANNRYSRYGGRGIKVCERWIGTYGFVNFLEDVGERPTPKHSLNRKDNEKNYEPGNVEWATPHQQASNRRTNAKTVGVHYVKYGDKKWLAFMQIDRVMVLNERFDTELEAIEARRNAEIKYLGATL